MIINTAERKFSFQEYYQNILEKAEYASDLKIDWGIMEKVYGPGFKVQKAFHRAKCELEYAIYNAKEDQEQDVYEWSNLKRQINTCPVPPWGYSKPEIIEKPNGNGEEYFSIRSLWDLKRKIDTEYNYEGDECNCYYLPYLGDGDYNRYYTGSSDLETSIEIYKVQDLNIFVEVIKNSYQ